MSDTATASFVGTYRRSLDGKNRFTLPAKWRFEGDTSDRTFIARCRDNGTVAIDSPWKTAKIQAKLDNIPYSDPNREILVDSLFGDALQLGCDGQGRLMLSPEFVAKVGLEKDIALVGNGDSFKVTDASRLEAERAKPRPDHMDALRTLGL